MKRIAALLPLFFFAFTLSAQINPNFANAFEDGYSVQELEKIFENVTYKKHEKWLKKEGYNYNKEKSTKNYLYYDKNDVVSLALFHENEKIVEVMFHSSPQKYYQAVSAVSKDKSYKLIEEKIGDNGGGKFVSQSRWVKNGYLYQASVDNYNFHILKDEQNFSSKPAIISFKDKSPVSLAVDDILIKLESIGPVYPKAGSYYTGDEKLTQQLKALDNKGTIQVEKTRIPKNNYCESASSFHLHEVIKLNLEDVYYTSIRKYENKEKNAFTYALCLGIKDWENKGDRKYEMIGSSSDNKCFLSGTWSSSTKVNVFMKGYDNTAVSLEFTNEKQANEVKSLLDKAIAEAKK